MDKDLEKLTDIKYDVIQDKLSLVNDYFAKHIVMERLAFFLLTVSFVSAFIMSMFYNINENVFSVMAYLYSGIFILYVLGISGLRLVLDFLLKWKYGK